MNALKVVGAATIAAGKLTNQDVLFIISIIVTVLGMIQEYLSHREKEKEG